MTVYSRLLINQRAMMGPMLTQLALIMTTSYFRLMERRRSRKITKRCTRTTKMRSLRQSHPSPRMTTEG